MTAQAGRDAVLSKNSVALAGMRQLGVTYSGEPIDISSGEDGPFSVFLAGQSSTETLELSFEGVIKDDTLRAIGLGGAGVDKLLTDLTLDYGDGGSLTGDFFMSGYADGNEHRGESTFTATFRASGPWLYTPAA